MKRSRRITELVLSTGNRHKVAEITALLVGSGIRVVPVSAFPGVPEVVEDGDTLEQNAVKKARTVALLLKRWVLADDTGLEVDFLNGAPGVYSARWAGPGCTYADNNRKLLSFLAGVPVPSRTARFRCVIALADPSGKVWTVDGSVRGRIAERPRGAAGFGYDPVFYVPERRATFAELSAEVKNVLSHRGRALRKVRVLLRRLNGTR